MTPSVPIDGATVGQVLLISTAYATGADWVSAELGVSSHVVVAASIGAGASLSVVHPKNLWLAITTLLMNVGIGIYVTQLLQYWMAQRTDWPEKLMAPEAFVLAATGQLLLPIGVKWVQSRLGGLQHEP